VPIILTRRSCILISILHIRALIKPDRVIIFNTAGSTETDTQKDFKSHLERNIQAGLKVQDCLDGEEGGLVYEHRCVGC
jgi:magnesium transporter